MFYEFFVDKCVLFYLSKLTVTLSKLGEGGIPDSQVFTVLSPPLGFEPWTRLQVSYPGRMFEVKVWKDLLLSFLFIFNGISPPNKNKCFIFIFTIDSFASLTKNYCSGDLDNSLNCPLAAGNPAKVSPIVNKIG